MIDIDLQPGDKVWDAQEVEDPGISKRERIVGTVAEPGTVGWASCHFDGEKDIDEYSAEPPDAGMVLISWPRQIRWEYVEDVRKVS